MLTFVCLTHISAAHPSIPLFCGPGFPACFQVINCGLVCPEASCWTVTGLLLNEPRVSDHSSGSRAVLLSARLSARHTSNTAARAQLCDVEQPDRLRGPQLLEINSLR